jgi:hypothetical protein
LKRIVILVDSPDESADKVRERLEEILTKAGLRNMSEIVEFVERK